MIKLILICSLILVGCGSAGGGAGSTSSAAGSTTAPVTQAQAITLPPSITGCYPIKVESDGSVSFYLLARTIAINQIGASGTANLSTSELVTSDVFVRQNAGGDQSTVYAIQYGSQVVYSGHVRLAPATVSALFTVDPQSGLPSGCIQSVEFVNVYSMALAGGDVLAGTMKLWHMGKVGIAFANL